jgi:hypothetical protein
MNMFKAIRDWLFEPPNDNQQLADLREEQEILLFGIEKWKEAYAVLEERHRNLLLELDTLRPCKSKLDRLTEIAVQLRDTLIGDINWLSNMQNSISSRKQHNNTIVDACIFEWNKLLDIQDDTQDDNTECNITGKEDGAVVTTGEQNPKVSEPI